MREWVSFLSPSPNALYVHAVDVPICHYITIRFVVEQRIVSPYATEPGVFKRLGGNFQCGVVVCWDDPVCGTFTSKLSKAIFLGKTSEFSSVVVDSWHSVVRKQYFVHSCDDEKRVGKAVDVAECGMDQQGQTIKPTTETFGEGQDYSDGEVRRKDRIGL